jgi:hypothetical protein
MKDEVSPVVADGQGDADEGEGNVSKIRESHVGRGGLTCLFHFTALLRFTLTPYRDLS